MARSIVRYESGGVSRWGMLFGSAPTGPTDTADVASLDTAAQTTADLLSSLPEQWPSKATLKVPAQNLRSPVTSDAQVICQGLNYREHAEEASHAARKRNLIFAKASSSLAGPFDSITRPAEVELLDYEVEVGLVIAKRIDRKTRIDASNIADFVAGVVLCNDVSARDAMFGAPFLQWYQGKSYRGFCPCGPNLILLDHDECATTIENLRIELSVNGEERQGANTSHLIFKPAPTLTELSAWVDLRPGDLLLTGTPGGVTAGANAGFIEVLRTQLFDDALRLAGMRRELTRGRPFLKPGDSVTASLKDARTGELLSAHRSAIVGPE